MHFPANNRLVEWLIEHIIVIRNKRTITGTLLVPASEMESVVVVYGYSIWVRVQ